MASKTSLKSKRFIVCCYCLNDSTKLIEQYFISDEKDVYEKMVADTFNIQICHIKSIAKMICLKCVEDFRLAAKVKQKILDVQKTLLEQCDKIAEFGCNSPKLELETSDFDDIGFNDDLEKSGECKKDMDNAGGQVDKCPNGLVIKLEPIEEGTKEITRLKQKPLTMRKNLSRKIEKSSSKRKCVYKKINRKNDKEKPDSNEPRSTEENLTHIKHNTLNLLINSNMCMFKSKRIKFACFVCDRNFLDIRELREHSQLFSHSTDVKLISDISRCKGMKYKTVDISNLSCKLCANPCQNLIDLQLHLTNKHDLKFKNAEHLLVPFKLEEGFECVICQKEFQTFNRLSIHMNSHSTSNVCEICGTAYTNRQSLRSHINAMHREKKCPECPAIFQTVSAKTRHLRSVHNKGGYKRYCVKCEMTFPYDHNLKEHMIEKHGVKRQLADCEHCFKRFNTPLGLKTHIRAVHIRERRYPCSLCDMRFFTSTDKTRHERTHGDEKPFSCSFCEVKFKSKDSVRRHLKRQHGNSKTTNK